MEPVNLKLEEMLKNKSDMLDEVIVNYYTYKYYYH